MYCRIFLCSRLPCSGCCLQVEWGIDLQTEHERYLTEEVFKQPTIVYNYPKDIKAFYMRLNEDEKTVAAMDVLVPKVNICTCLERALSPGCIRMAALNSIFGGASSCWN